MLYKVESGMGWFITDAPTKREATKEATKEWGRGCYPTIIRATQDAVSYFKQVKGEDAIN